ncbi:hypothetical protein QBC45DRAFT_311877, partial [Copromyces sp. CBS 386.78]
HHCTSKMCTKKQYYFTLCGHTEWCESQCQTKMKRVLMNPQDDEYPPPCVPVTEILLDGMEPVKLVGTCSACRRREEATKKA